MPKPNFFIVGAPKSGTSSIYTYLKKHPQVFLAKKEIFYFCHDLTFRTPKLRESVFLSYFSDAKNQKAIGDAASIYLLSSGSAKEIKEFQPEAKIIMILRNPVQMVYSIHSELYYTGDEPIENFENALNAESSRRAGELIPPYHRGPLEAMFYSTVAKYYEQVLRYKNVFPDDKLHIILYDDFIANPEVEYRKVLKFLELDDFVPDSFEVVNSNKGPRSRLFLSFLVKPPDFIKSIGKVLFPHHTKRRIWLMKTLWNLNAKYKPRNPLTNELKQRLVDMYKDDIEKLAKLLNRDLNEWLKV
jgi:hypothetical protein